VTESLSLSLEIFRGVQVCKSFSNEQADIDRFEKAADKVYHVGRLKALISSVVIGINSLQSNFSTGITVWVGFILITHTSD
jgi:ABC-type bacteriocin/lantibiotic exporter with double-glycine peptidase domain